MGWQEDISSVNHAVNLFSEAIAISFIEQVYHVIHARNPLPIPCSVKFSHSVYVCIYTKLGRCKCVVGQASCRACTRANVQCAMRRQRTTATHTRAVPLTTGHSSTRSTIITRSTLEQNSAACKTFQRRPLWLKLLYTVCIV